MYKKMNYLSFHTALCTSAQKIVCVCVCVCVCVTLYYVKSFINDQTTWHLACLKI